MRERGLKFVVHPVGIFVIMRRSREGAWIEIKIRFLCCGEYGGRSREGAWIEIFIKSPTFLNQGQSLP